MPKLSSAQEQIVYAEIGIPIQVLACAGAGKTRVLTERIRQILQSTKKDGIISVTFTNKAAEEIRLRLGDIPDLTERCWLATIHSLAQRILDQYGHTIGLPPELHIYDRDQDRKAIFLQSLREDGLDIDTFLEAGDDREKKKRERVVQDLLETFSAAKRNLLTDEEIIQNSEDGEEILRYFKAYRRALLAAQAIDFDDILLLGGRILSEHSWVGDIYRAKYRHLLVDEAQDLNRAQYEFIKVLCGDSIKSIMMVGDPDQMIYGFNDSSEKFLTDSFVQDFAPVVFRLTENYRSTLAVVKAANRLKPGSQSEKNLALQGKCEVTQHPDEKAEAGWLCETIESLLGESSPEIEGQLGLEHMVVIARNKFIFLKVEDELQHRGIQFAYQKGDRNAEPITKMAKLLDYGIRFKVNPKDWVAGKKLCDTIGISYPESWSDSKQLVDFAKLQSDAIVTKLLCLIESLAAENPNIPHLCAVMKEALSVESSTLSDEERALSIREMEGFHSLWVLFRRKGLGDSLAAFRNALSLGQLAAPLTNGGLTLSTVHTMKGMEKDIVFLMGMTEGAFPDYRAKTKKEIDEEKNNAYVAVTRARRWLFISYPLQREMPWGAMKPQIPSRFITAMGFDAQQGS